MKVYNIYCESYDEAYHDSIIRLVDGPYEKYDDAVKNLPAKVSTMGSTYSYYIKEVELK